MKREKTKELTKKKSFSQAAAQVTRGSVTNRTSGTDGSNFNLTRAERTRKFGIDCPDALVWRHWGVGGEYLMKLIIKNTHDKLQVLQYRLPREKATFFVEFPEPVTLSSGMGYELIVRFRPSEMREFQDSMEIDVEGRGVFSVRLSALTPYAKLNAPEKYDFGFCPVNAVSTTTLTISNGGTVPLRFSWAAPEPFTLEPTQSELEEGAKMTITVKFRPTDASAVVGQAVCTMEGGTVLAVLKISGIGKYVYIQADNKLIDFGGALTTTTLQKTITVQNKSCVAGTFEIHRTDSDIVNPFTFFPTKGCIPREGAVQLNVKYKPECAGAQYSNDFIMTTVGGNKIQFRCTAEALGPQVSLSVRALDYGDVDLDSQDRPEKVLVIKNHGDTDVYYDFVGCDPGCAFVVNPCQGMLAPHKMQNVFVKFFPSAPINYLKRVHVLVKHSNRCLFVDLLGTGFNAKTRPAPFDHKHVRYFRSRIMNGLSRSTPDDIGALLAGMENGVPAEDGDEQAARDVLRMCIEQGESPYAEHTESVGVVLPSEVEALHLPFSIDTQSHLFTYGSTESRAVTVHNHTSAKASAVWCLPPLAGATTTGPWSVTPATADVPAFGSYTFNIKLRSEGMVKGASFGNTLECYCFFKSMRSFRLVSELTFAPPLCLSVAVQCVTPLSETSATPQISLPSSIAFPSCHQNRSTFQVIPVVNHGDTVAAFEINIEGVVGRDGKKRNTSLLDQSPVLEGDVGDGGLDEVEEPEVFTCFPASGTIGPKGTALVLFRFQPPTVTRYRGTARFRFNRSSVGSQMIGLLGEGFVPQIILSNNGIMYYRPTAVGGFTERDYVIENPARIPVDFQVEVPPRFRDIMQINPPNGTLRGSERLTLKARFSPQIPKRYETKMNFTISSQDSEESYTQGCHVIGEGVLAVISIEPLDVMFGSIMVGAEARETVSIFNSSLCDVQFKMMHRARDESCTDAPPLTFLPESTGIIRARSHLNVGVAVTLPRRGSFAYIVYVVTGASMDELTDENLTVDEVRKLPHCDVTVTGGHPTLEITDVRSVYQSKSNLWRQMSVPKINDELKVPVLARDIETKSFTFQKAAESLEPFFCDMGVDVYRTAPIRVLVRFDNIGHCPVKYRFWFPHESDVVKEQWHHEPANRQQDQAQEETIDRQLFDVSPRSATVPPGGHVVVLFSYQHSMVGEHSLPILLRMDQGKRIMFDLHGRTIDESEKFLAFNHAKFHSLLPVAIGDMDPPLQYTELRNLSHQAATYNVDSAALQAVRDANYDFPIFQCLNPQGTIPPMSTLLLSWYFRPLEEKKYTLDVPIRVVDGETYTLSMVGKGYHPKKTPAEQVRQMHKAELLALPVFPTLSHPLLPMRLSMDVLRLGAIPFHSLHRQVVIIRNDHPTDTFLFEWHCALQYGDQLLEVDPPRGKLGPGDSAQMRVTLYSGSTSHVIDNSIHCHVLNEDLRNRRLKKREQLEYENAMQLDHPTQESQSNTSSAVRESQLLKAAGKTRAPITAVPAKFQSTHRLKRAIEQLTEAAVAEELDENDEELIYVDVMPTILDLLVQARIVPLEMFADVYGDNAVKSFHCPTLRVYENPEDLEGPLEASPAEEAVVRDVIDGFLREVVHSRLVKEAYLDVSDDPVPFFADIVRNARGDADTANTGPVSDDAARPDTAATEEEGEAGTPPAADATDATEGAPLGELQCLVEEVLEEAIYSIIRETHTSNGTFLNVQQKTSFKRSQPAAGSALDLRKMRTGGSKMQIPP